MTTKKQANFSQHNLRSTKSDESYEQQKILAGHLLVKCLEAQQVERVFCVPGESYLAVLDGLYDSKIKAVLCRQEGGAAMMAEATGKLTGRPGICFVTRGPGATNAAAGVHVAQQDETPMILFIGQVATHMRDRDAFQEVDYKQMFGTMAKWVAEIDHPNRIPEYIQRAFHVAMNGRPGPVVLSLPEDMLVCKTSVQPASYVAPVLTHPSQEQITQLGQMLESAAKPLAILGGQGWSAEAVNQIQQFAENYDLPVACALRRQMLFDNAHPNYIGDVGIAINPYLKQRVAEADLLLLIGERLSEMPSQGYNLLNIPQPKQKLVHVHAGAEELGRLYRPDLAINASPSAFCRALQSLTPIKHSRWSEQRQQDRHAYEGWSTSFQKQPGSLQMGEVMQWLEENLTENTCITNGAGNFATWAHRYHRYQGFGSQLAPTSGSMGYGLPAAIAAKLNDKEKTVVCFTGDGDFQMTMQELGTAVQEHLGIIIVVIDNSKYGTIRMHQEREYPGRVSATTLQNPDFAELAKAYGVNAYRITTTSEFADALTAIFEEIKVNHAKPQLLHLIIP
ncbi:thiamine pyrophosphate-binding protein [Polycladidibacter stylochi]|uniref:thiamine pyrophosphate-binding protein n=1 Tax=Polycladidibacter stylochi TaxID=1807766 RepID=UPI000836ACB2|nr:thiamine pyrophosphate-binding protein [Pseudovibrio stylochi]